MMYLLTKLWKLSILLEFNKLTNILFNILTNYWLKGYKILDCESEWFINNSLVILTVDLYKYPLSPNLLGCVFLTILNREDCQSFGSSKSVLLSVGYEGDFRSIYKHFIITKNSTPEEFIKHFLHYTDLHGQGESKIVLINAQILTIKIFPNKS